MSHQEPRRPALFLPPFEFFFATRATYIPTPLARHLPPIYVARLTFPPQLADHLTGECLMSEVSERRRKPRQTPGRPGEPVWVILLNIPGSTAEVRAKVVDSSELGLGVETDCRLEPNVVLTVDGHLANHGTNGKLRARVVDCTPFHGAFRAGLTFEASHQNDAAHENGNGAAAPASNEAVPDYYELLQISPNADPDMIHRVYRLLAQRYHPDNGTTGDEKAFRAISDAYKVLSEPEKRAAYDVHLHSYRQVRWRIFDQRQAAIGKIAEKSKRKGIIDLLYTKRCNEPEKPTMNLHELEDLLGCPREHLEFSLWYLKENGLVARMDNGRFAVTAKGVDWAEQEEAAALMRADRLLPASSNAEPN
jgi:curved DNA-binding protein CbpA